MAKVINDNQIIRKDGKNCFVEALRNSYGIGKILLKFVTYDLSRQAGDKFTNEIDIYMDFAKFNRIAADYLDNGELKWALDNDRANVANGQVKYANQITLHQGGTSDQRLRAQNKSRPDGKAEARILKIYAGSKFPVILQAEAGPGEVQGKGLIVPKFNGGKPEKMVRIALSFDDIKELFIAVRNDIQGYITAKNIENAEKIKFLEDKVDVLTALISSMSTQMGINAQAIISDIETKKKQERQNTYNKSNNYNNNNNNYYNNEPPVQESQWGQWNEPNPVQGMYNQAPQPQQAEPYPAPPVYQQDFFGN